MATSSLIQEFYSLNPQPHCRPSNKPLQVLALGLPRSGTESLCQTLLTLGYSQVFHGFNLAHPNPEDCIVWKHLLDLKAQSVSKGEQVKELCDFDWDRLVGDCDCITDAPSCIFAHELLDCYDDRDVRVIVNRRRDMDAWEKSFDMAAEFALESRILWWLSWFDARLFWWLSVIRGVFVHMTTLPSDDGAEGRVQDEKSRNSAVQTRRVSGKAWAEAYYPGLEEKLKRDGRDWLDWDVHDGWEPLCRFLGKEVPPEEPFPNGNKAGKQFDKNMERVLQKIVTAAAVNATLCAAGVEVVAVVLW